MKNLVRLALCALVCLIFGSVSVDAQQNITTLVGGGPGTGIPASPALPARTSSVGSPAAVRFDTLGNMYVLDNTFGRVLKVNLTTGQTTSYAGNGTTGYSGDNGPATNAQLNGPSGMCIDSHDNLYIADSDNAVIRVVIGPSGTTPAITTGTFVAGDIYTIVGIFTNSNPVFGGDNGPALSSHLHFPDGCALDSKGNLYIADRGNNEVRVVLSALGAATPPVGLGPGPLVAGDIYRFAGTAGGSFPTQPAGGYAADGSAAVTGAVYGPFDVFVDPSNNVFIADLGNNFDPNTGKPDALTGVPPNNNVVREVFASDGTIHTVAGSVTLVAGVPTGQYPIPPNPGPSATGAAVGALLYEPKGLSMDAAGNLYFCDAVNQVIRKVTTPGVAGSQISVVAGTLGSHGFSGDTHAATSASLTFPAGSFVDANGVLYIADVGSNALRVVPMSGPFTGSGVTVALNNIDTIAGNGKLSYGGDGLTAVVAELNSPAGIAVDGSGNLSIADSGSDLIRYVTASGVVSTIAGAPENNGFGVSPSVINQAIGVATDAAGNVYVADTANCLVRKISAAGGAVTTIAGVVPTTNPVCGFVSQGGPAVGTTLGVVNGVALDSHGNVFFSDSTNNVIWEVPVATAGTLVANNAYIVAGTPSTTGAFGGEAGPATQAQLNIPMGIYIDVYNNLFIADAANHRIREVPAINIGGTMNAGSIYTIAGTGAQGITGDTGVATSAEIQFPYAIVVDHNESVFFTDTTFSLDLAIPAPHAASSNTIRQIAGSGVTGKTQGHIYPVVNTTGASGFSGDGAAATGAQLNFPTGLALFPNGGSTTANLLISDSINNRVRSVAGIANVPAVAIVSLSPNPASFATAEPIGTASAPVPITVTNTAASGGPSLTVNTASGITIGGADAGDFSVGTNTCTAALAPAASCTINVIFTPTAVGTRNATLSVASTAFGVPQIALTGTGGTPTATLNPTSLTFASTTVGTAAPTQTVTLSNTGNAAAIVTGITFTGTNLGDYSETDTCVGVVGGIPATTGTCTITVTFKPTAVGASTATMTVASNVAGAANTVALSGTGAAATLTLKVTDTDTSSTQTVTAGSTATYNLSVSGNQSVTATITCAGAPTAATCSPTPGSVAVTPTAAGTFKVSVTTTARGEMLPFNQPSMKMQPPSMMQVLPMASLALLFIIAMMFGWMQNQAGRARLVRVALSVALILMPIAAATVLVGCGGGSSSTPPPPVTGTPAGSYTLTVTATSGSTTASTTVTLVVN
jgi:sugar lactone lactonase YvrE